MGLYANSDITASRKLDVYGAVRSQTGSGASRQMRSGSVRATYFHGLRGPGYRRDSGNNVRWYLYDGLGSALGELDLSGNITASRKLDVYGAVRSSAGTSTSRHKFVGGLGHPSEDESGYIYMRARYYDPVTGRFASEDPGRDGNNWFQYCSNNPVNMVDETGKVAGRAYACAAAAYAYTAAFVALLFMFPVGAVLPQAWPLLMALALSAILLFTLALLALPMEAAALTGGFVTAAWLYAPFILETMVKNAALSNLSSCSYMAAVVINAYAFAVVAALILTEVLDGVSMQIQANSSN